MTHLLSLVQDSHRAPARTKSALKNIGRIQQLIKIGTSSPSCHQKFDLKPLVLKEVARLHKYLHGKRSVIPCSSALTGIRRIR